MSFAFNHLNLSELEGLAARCANVWHTPILISLDGEMGAGKTSFARAFIKQLLGDKDLVVPSPTFSILQPFEINKPSALAGILHTDLYRLAAEDEVYELGIDDYKKHWLVLAEWLQNAQGALGEPDIIVQIKQSKHHDQRDVTLAANSHSGRSMLADLA